MLQSLKIVTDSERNFADAVCMDITSINGASAFAQQTTADNASIAVAAKVLQAQKQDGAAALQLLQASTLPTSNGSTRGLDIRA